MGDEVLLTLTAPAPSELITIDVTAVLMLPFIDSPAYGLTLKAVT